MTALTTRKGFPPAPCLPAFVGRTQDFRRTDHERLAASAALVALIAQQAGNVLLTIIRITFGHIISFLLQ
jgi:hypothetical protein